MTALALLITTVAHAEPMWPAGDRVEPSIFFDVTEEGFDQIEPILAAVLPPTVPIDTSGLVQGDTLGGGFAGVEYEFGVTNLVVLPTIEHADFIPKPAGPDSCRPTVPGNGTLDIDVQLDVGINTNNDRAHAYFTGDVELFWGLIDFDINQSCDIYMSPKAVTATVPLTIGPDLDPFSCQPNLSPSGCIRPEIVFGPIEWDLAISSLNDFNLDCSGFIDLILTIADFIGLDPVEILLESLRPSIDEQIYTITTDLQAQLDEIMAQTEIETSLDLLGNTYDVSICPVDMFVDSRGMRLEMAGLVDPGDFPAACISQYDPGGSRLTIPATNPRYPDLRDAGVPFEEHVAININDDFVNQALYGLWRNGLLCQSFDAETAPVDLPIDLDTSLLDLLSQQQYTELFPTAKPLTIATRPEKPPTFSMTNGVPAAVLDVNDLGIDFFAELDGRLVRAVGVDLQIRAGVDVAFDASTGTLGAAVDFDPAAVVASVSFNDLVPAASDEIEGGFGAIVETVAGPLVNDALGENLTFALPSFKVTPEQPQPIGISTALLAASGPLRDFMGVFADVGVVGYDGSAAAEGCDLFGGSGGCDSSGGGCGGGGCTNGPVPVRIGIALFALGVALRRRRQD